MALIPADYPEGKPFLSEEDILHLRRQFGPSQNMFKQLYMGNWEPENYVIGRDQDGPITIKGEADMAVQKCTNSLAWGTTPEFTKRKTKPTLKQQMELALKNIEKKRKAADARKALEWSFVAPHEDAVNMEEISATLTRENPVAIVTQKDFNANAAVLIHSAIVNKSGVLNIRRTFKEDVKPLYDGHFCVLVQNAKELNKVIQWVKNVRIGSWNKETKTTITVKYPKV